MTSGCTEAAWTGTSATVAPLRPMSNVPPGTEMNSGVNVTGFGPGSGSFGFSIGGLSPPPGVGVGLGHITQAPIPPVTNTSNKTPAATYGNKFRFPATAAGGTFTKVG